jgi:hypothetical protein
MHTWVNKGSVPAVTAFILIDAKPVEVNGKEMRTVFPVFCPDRRASALPFYP